MTFVCWSCRPNLSASVNSSNAASLLLIFPIEATLSHLKSSPCWIWRLHCLGFPGLCTSSSSSAVLSFISTTSASLRSVILCYEHILDSKQPHVQPLRTQHSRATSSPCVSLCAKWQSTSFMWITVALLGSIFRDHLSMQTGSTPFHLQFIFIREATCQT